MGRPKKKKTEPTDVELEIINATMQGQMYAVKDRERREALRVLARMKELELKFGRLVAKGKATRTTTDEMNGKRTAYRRDWNAQI